MQRISSAVLAGTAALGLLVVDARTAAPFDAPKRLVVMLGLSLAMAILAIVREPSSRPWTRRQRIVATAAAIAFGFVVLSAVLSPHRAAALDATRAIVVFLLVIPLAASEDRAWEWTANAFITGAVINGVVSLIQWMRGAETISFRQAGGRAATYAMTGNTGVLGLVAAFAIVLLLPRLAKRSVGAWVACAILLATIVVNRSLTPLLVLVAGVAVYFAPRLAWKSAIAVAVLVVSAGAFDVSQRVNRLLTYRLGPWSAAVSMVAARPLLGFGPGTFAAEYARHVDLRFVNPSFAGSYAQAHNEYLQALAEWGAPATLALLVALGLLLFAARGNPLVLALLVGGMVAALTWFPLQRPETAVLLLAAAGRAWREA